MQTIRMPEEQIPVVGEWDVLVAGSGPAGICAALTAARSGARTLLMEQNGCLGGIWTAGLLSLVIDAENKPGILAEILARCEALTPAPYPLHYQPETMKFVLEDLCREAGLDLRLHTRIGPVRVHDRQITEVITDSKSGREAWRAGRYVDATGDGDLAAAAGCGFDFGRDASHETQPFTLLAMVCGVAFEDMQPFVTGGEERKTRFLAELQRAGVDPSYQKCTLFAVADNLFTLMINHEYGLNGTSADDLTRGTLRARREVFTAVRRLRALGGIWKTLALAATAEHIGVREGRRIHGLYQVTRDDMEAGRTHEDAVCRVRFGADIHSTNPGRGRGYSHEKVQARPYDVPRRALIARDVDNLLLAGRCISGDFYAHASYRVTGNAAALGEAAGRTAADSLRTGRSLHAGA